MKIYFNIKNDLPHQIQWWNLTNYIKLMVGGFGCGKTHIGAKRLIRDSLYNGAIPVQYISPSYKMAKKTIIPTMIEILDRSQIRYEYNKTDFEFRFPWWDGTVWIGSGDEPKSLLGPNLACAGIDEPFIQDKRVFDIVLSRVRHPKAKLREIFMTGTPEQLNWGYDIANNEEGNYDIGVVISSTRANKYLPKEFLDSLLSGYSEQMVKAYVDGQFVNLSQGIVYNVFDRNTHSKACKYSELLPLNTTFDFNVNPMHVAIIQEHKEISYQIDEIIIPTSNTNEVCREILNRYGKHQAGFTIFGDASGRAKTTKSHQTDYQIIQDILGGLNNFTIRVPSANPAVRDRVNAVNARLKNSKGVINYYVDPSCKITIKSFERTQYKEGTSDIDKALGVEHITDAIGYYINIQYPIVKSIIRSHNA